MTPPMWRKNSKNSPVNTDLCIPSASTHAVGRLIRGKFIVGRFCWGRYNGKRVNGEGSAERGSKGGGSAGNAPRENPRGGGGVGRNREGRGRRLPLKSHTWDMGDTAFSKNLNHHEKNKLNLPQLSKEF